MSGVGHEQCMLAAPLLSSTWDLPCHTCTAAGRGYYERGRRNPKTRAAQQLRELEGRERLDRSRIERRLHLTALAGAPLESLVVLSAAPPTHILHHHIM